MRGCRSRFVWVFCPALTACGQTSYDLYEYVGDGDTVAGGQPGLGGDSNSATTGGSGGVLVGDPDQCQASRDTSLDVIRLLIPSEDLCLTQGDATTFIDSLGYEITMRPCGEEVSQYWTVDWLSDGSWEIRHEAAAMNLDVNYAASSDGTPVVLFEPHQLYNQRFFIIPSSGDSFLLAPRHVEGKCIEVRGDAVEIWPCDSSNPAQNFQQISCVNDG